MTTNVTAKVGEPTPIPKRPEFYAVIVFNPSCGWVGLNIGTDRSLFQRAHSDRPGSVFVTIPAEGTSGAADLGTAPHGECEARSAKAAAPSPTHEPKWACTCKVTPLRGGVLDPTCPVHAPPPAQLETLGEVKRYNMDLIISPANNPGCAMRPATCGNWVRYEDYHAARAEVERLRKELTRQQQSHESIAAMLEHPENVTPKGFDAIVQQARRCVQAASNALTTETKA